LNNTKTNQSILLVESNQFIRESVIDSIQSNFPGTEAVSSTGLAIEALRKKAFGLLILHIEGKYCFKFLEICQSKYSDMKIILIVSDDLKDHFSSIIKFPSIKNIIALRPTLSKNELLATVLLVFNNALFKVNLLVKNIPETLRIEINDSKEKENHINTASKFLNNFNLSARLLRNILSTMDELIMNIIFNAPTDTNGNRIYKDFARNEQIILNNKQQGLLTINYSTQYIAISAYDPFGSIDAHTVMSHLNKCFANNGKVDINPDSGSTGIGLYQMYQYSDFFIVSIQPQKSTEFMVIFDLKINDRARSKYSKSLHFFEQNPANKETE
jgi:hypothetical protein